MSQQPVEREMNVDQSNLDQIFRNMEVLESLFIKEAKKFIELENAQGKKNIFSMDYFISAIVNRAIFLMRGFKVLAVDNNYICATALIRLQIDNSLRFFAATIVNNRDDFYNKYLAGEHISNMLDTDGNKMSDNYLAKKLDKEMFPGILLLYKNTSGYIHLSNQHSLLQTQIVDDKKRRISTKIGYFDFFQLIKRSILHLICLQPVSLYLNCPHHGKRKRKELWM